MKKFVIWIALWLLILIVVTFCFYYSFNYVDGSALSKTIEELELSHVVVTKTFENGAASGHVVTYELTENEQKALNIYLQKTELKNIRHQPRAISTDIRYYLMYYDTNGDVVATIKLYNDEMMIFDFSDGTAPAIHGRYSIIETQLAAFLEVILD